MSLHVSEEWLADYQKRQAKGESPEAALNGLLEDEEQMLLIQWADWNLGKWPELALLFHIPNGGRRSAAEAGRFRAMGVKKGVPDLFLPVARGGFHGLFIEMKRRRGGSLSPEQGDWLEALRGEGYRALRCDGWEQARDALVEYLEMEATI